MHGGRIQVESEGIEGKGSTFTFWIPISQAETGPAQLKGATPGRDDAIRPLVLVVTNDDSHQQFVGEYLKGAGYDITVVAETATLLAALKARQPYAVLIDRKMGGLSLPSGPSQSDFSDTLIQRKYSTCITPGIPQVIFSDDGKGRLVFNLSDGEGNLSDRTSSRLADAIRRSKPTSQKELKTALIIDHDPAFLELRTKTLLQKGLRVLRASDGPTGVYHAVNHLPEVIILDFNLPESNGMQVVEQLRAHPRTKDIPIMINTGETLNEEERQQLAGYVQSITYKTERESLFVELDRLTDVPEEIAGIGKNL
jgi:CheY-like chemotaxis protein